VLCGAQFTFLQDDIGIPANYRHMEGFGVHTYTLLNKEGRVTYVKFHWQPSCGAPRAPPARVAPGPGGAAACVSQLIDLSASYCNFFW